MNIRVGYLAQIAAAVGSSSESLDLSGGATAADALADLHARRGQELANLVFGADGQVLRSVIVCVNDKQVETLDQTPLSDGDEILLFSAISGG